MTKESLVFLFGVIVLITPYIGIPEDWKVYIHIFSGVLLMVVGYSLRQKAYIRSIEKENGERDTDSFMESNGTRDKDEKELSI
jgi:uncharacterized membrane protein